VASEGRSASISEVISSQELLRSAPLPSHEAVRLLAKATGRHPGAIRAGIAVESAAMVKFASLVKQRISGEPLQYLEGEVPFGPVTVFIDGRVLIPRPETEYLYDLVVRSIAPPQVVVDLCTGSGALALALKRTYPEARVIASDLSAGAMEVAESNGRRLGLDIEWFRGDLWAPVPVELAGEVSLMVANPPYVSESEWAHLPIEIQREPRMALVGGPTGTEVIERLLEQTATWLAPRGIAVIEVGDGQAGSLSEGRDEVETLMDQFERPRFVKLLGPIASS